ncbi:hypothetical protein EBZ80_25720, partial [bacterium]|nr:hypothetical protein [bacterium]
METGLHEIHHALLKYFLDVKNESRLNPRQRKLVQDINQLYKQTTEAAIKDGHFDQGTLDQLRARLGEDFSDLSLPTDADKNAYAFVNIDEWTSAVMSNRNLREYMKGLEMPRDKVTGKIRTVWEAFKDYVAKLFGIDRSVHRKAFDKIMELATDREAGRLKGGEMAYRPQDEAPLSQEDLDTLLWSYERNPLTPEARDAVSKMSEDELREFIRGAELSDNLFGVPTTNDNLNAANIRLRKEFGNRLDYASHLEEVRSSRVYGVLDRLNLSDKQLGDIQFGDEGTYQHGVPVTRETQDAADGILRNRDGKLFRPGDARFTRKVSTAKPNEELAPEDKVTFASQKVPQAEMTAEQWLSNGGSFEDLINRKTPLSVPEVYRALDILGSEARATKVRIEQMPNPDARDIALKLAAADRERAAGQLVARMLSEGGQLLGHGQHVDFDADSRGGTLTPDGAIRILLDGKTPEQMASGKIDLQRMVQGIRDIKLEAANIAMKALGDELSVAGVKDPKGELHNMLRDTLAHPDTTFKDVVNMLAYMLPGNNAAKTRAMAERLHRFYSIAANTV